MISTIQNKIQNIATLVACKTINGTSFVGVRGYENSKGEVSNQTFVVGISYANLLKNDLVKLQAFNINPLIKKYDKEVVSKAYAELLISLTKRTASEFEKEILREAGDSTIKRSDAQTDAYTHLTKGLKEKEGNLFIYGLCVAKEVLVKGDYPTVNSQLKTIVKNEIKKNAELSEKKFKQFKLGALETLKIQGLSI